MKRHVCWLSLALVGFCTSAARAQSDPAAALAPYVDEYTFLVGEINVEAFNVETLVARLQKLNAADSVVANMRKGLDEARDLFLKTGAKRIYVTWNFVPGPGMGPLLAVPLDARTDRDGLVRLFEKDPAFKTQVRGKILLAGHEKVLAAAKDRTPKAIPALAKAMAAVDQSPHRFALVIPDVVRKTQKELAPQLPKELGGAALTPAVEAVAWAALGIDLGAKLDVRLLIHAKNDEAAKRLEQFVEAVGAAIKGQEKNAETMAMLGRLFQALRPKRAGSQLAFTVDAKAFDDAALPLVAKARGAAAQAQAINNLKQIGLAMHNYYSVHKNLPPQGNLSQRKKTLLSWRVHILPYIEQADLYQKFKLDEPWDSAHNKKLIPLMPAIYHSPLSNLKQADGKTTFLVPAGPQLIFDGGRTFKFNQITDGTSNTILAIDADDGKAVVWTQPDDLTVDQKQPKAGVVRKGVGILSVYCDGSARVLPPTISDETMWNLFCPNDGNVINLDK